jgi:hypothetical protein
MNTFISLVILASMVGFVVGLIMCLSSAKRPRGKIVAGASFASFLLFCFALGSRLPDASSPTNAEASPQNGNPVTQPVRVASAAPVARKLSHGDMVNQFRIKGVSWAKDGFGTVMVASFTIHNDNTVPVKDVKITCASSGLSGSDIDQNTKTVFDRVGERSFLQVTKMNMGFIRSEAVDTKCKVVDFTPA